MLYHRLKNEQNGSDELDDMFIYPRCLIRVRDHRGGPFQLMGDRFMTLMRVGAWALDLSSFEVSLFLQQHIFLI